MSSGTKRAPFSLCGSFNMTKPKDCLSLPSAGRFAHELQYVAATAPLSSVLKMSLMVYLIYQCLYFNVCISLLLLQEGQMTD